MSTLQLTPHIAAAIEELERDFGDVTVEPDGSGGVYVRVGEVQAGPQWEPAIIPVEFQILFNYPFAAIYPYYTTDELSRVEGAWPTAMQHVDWRGRRVVQISLRATRWQPNIETASSALAQVRHWLQAPT
jgi:hypothetical protein